MTKEQVTNNELDQNLEDIGAAVPAEDPVAANDSAPAQDDTKAETDETPELKKAAKIIKVGKKIPDISELDPANGYVGQDPASEPTVSESLSLEDQIEGWREIANELAIQLNAAKGEQVDNAREKTWRTVVGKLNETMNNYSKANEQIGYVVLIERQKTTNAGFLRINVRTDNEGYQMVQDINAAVAKFCQEDMDSPVEITTSMSDSTKTDKILASTIAGYGLHTYPLFPEYVSPKKLIPLDDLPKSNPGLVGNVNGLKLNR